MAHEIIPIQRITREARESAQRFTNANDANPYPVGSSAANLFKEQFFIARELRAKGLPA